jgi:hypothetical protein
MGISHAAEAIPLWVSATQTSSAYPGGIGGQSASINRQFPSGEES